MAQFRRYRFVARDPLGNPIPNATVEVRKQGATIVSVAGATVTVNDPGGIIAGDACRLNNGTSDIGNGVLSVTATTVVFNTAPGVGANNDRLSPRTNLITIYADAQGAETIANPILTGLDGVATWWAINQATDLLVTAGGTTQIIQDFDTTGENYLSNVFDGASAIAWIKDTARSLVTSGARLIQFRNAGANKLGITKDGGLSSGAVNGASAVGYVLDTDNSLSTTGAKLLSLRNAGAEKFSIDKDGTFTIPRLGPTSTPTTGGALRIVDGNIFPITVAGVQAALDECETAGGGEVWVPASAGIVITNTSIKIGNRVKLVGRGDHNATATFIGTNTTNVSAMVENKVQDGSQQYAYISNIYINGNRSSGALVTRGLNFKQIYLGSVMEDMLVTNCSGNNIVIDGGVAFPHQQGGPNVARNCVTTFGGDDNFLVTGEVNQIRLENIASESVDAGKAQLKITGAGNTVASAGHVLRGIYFEGVPAADGLVIDSCCNVMVSGLMQNSANANNAVKITGATGGSDGAFAAGGHVIQNVGGNIAVIIDDQVAGVQVGNAQGRFVKWYSSPVSSATLDKSQIVGLQSQRRGVALTAAATITPGDGNLFHVTGNTTINTVTGAARDDARVITLRFDGTPHVNVSGNINLNGTTDYIATVGSTLSLMYDASTSKWTEVGRAIL